MVMTEQQSALAKTDESEFELMDRFDEEQILQELQGNDMLQEYFYEFTNSQGKLVTGLSWKGTKEFVRSMSRLGIPLSTEDIKFEDLGDRVRAKAYIRFIPTGELHVGISHQNKMMEVYKKDEKGNRTGEKELVPDPFYDEKAASKAKRNAIHEIIPEQVLKAEYQRWKEQKAKGKWPDPPSASAVAKAIPRGKGKASDSAAPVTNPAEASEKQQQATQIKQQDPLNIEIFQWYAKGLDGKNRPWKKGDDWGFCNVEFNGEIVELAKPIVAAIANNGGRLERDSEELTFEKGQLLRKVVGATL